jgi:hypothetical protein
VARYLKGAPMLEWHFNYQPLPTKTATFLDSDWAGAEAQRRSTICTIAMLGKHVLDTSSSTQAVRSLSSSECQGRR